MTITVLLVDDEPLVRSGLRAVLAGAEGIEVVGEAGDGADVPATVTGLRPSVVLMDVRMPRIDGISATQRLMAAPEPPKVLVVTTFENDEYVYAALRAGASGFLLKRAQHRKSCRPSVLSRPEIRCCFRPRSGRWCAHSVAARTLCRSSG